MCSCAAWFNFQLSWFWSVAKTHISGLLRIRIFHAWAANVCSCQNDKLPSFQGPDWKILKRRLHGLWGWSKVMTKWMVEKVSQVIEIADHLFSHQLLHLGMPMKWNKLTKEIKHLYIYLYITTIKYLSISSQHEIVKLKAALIPSFAAKTSRLRIQTSPFFSAAPQTKIIRTTMLKPVTPTSTIQEGSWNSSYTLSFEGSAIYFCPT